MAKFEPKYVMLVHSIIVVFFDVNFLFMPVMAGTMMGISTDASGGIFARFMGRLILFDMQLCYLLVVTYSILPRDK